MGNTPQKQMSHRETHYTRVTRLTNTHHIERTRYTHAPELTFLEKMFCKEKQSVAVRALISPERSKDNSVTVARRTPPMIGIRDTYT